MILVDDSLWHLYSPTQSSTGRDSSIHLCQKVIVETSRRKVSCDIEGIVQTIAQISVAVVFVCMLKTKSMADFVTPVGTDSEIKIGVG